jgi:hypothetical protein
MRARLEWSSKSSPIDIESLGELDDWLEKISLESTSFPRIVVLTVDEIQVTFGVGLPEKSFIQLCNASGDGPYLVVFGNSENDNVLSFYFLGNHHTEIPNSYLIPIDEVKNIVREVFVTGQMPTGIEWQEI